MGFTKGLRQRFVLDFFISLRLVHSSLKVMKKVVNMAAGRFLREFLHNERAMHRERVFHDRQNPLDYLSEDELITKYRFSRAGIFF